MVGRLLDEDPELAYEHAQAAVQRAGRVDVVREAAGLAAYRTGRFAEALRELRTVRRLNGSSEHLPIMADCERGLGRPERAIALSQEPEAETLDAAGRLELAIVVSGARVDLGEFDAALATLATPAVRGAKGVAAARVAQARSAAFEAAGRTEEAAAELAPYSAAQLAEADGGVADDEDDVVVYDLVEDESGDESGDEAGDEVEGGVDEVLPGSTDGVEADVAGAADASASAAASDGDGDGAEGAGDEERA
ncbi:hypothetical protein [Cellulomonas sp. JH27-2]|uniref:hypothetical protein n=1 Tax=Cellulomonas sp. JH27-2 TaxID=2774139 RepID=UPI001CD88ABB|nr:hypothetical protein [Cellulomonas sp. JH27-2]